GRYMYHWPISRRFRDGMISEGLFALTLMIDGLPYDRPVWEIAARKIESRINQFLNDNQSATSPSLRQQYYLKADGKDPIYLGDSIEVPEESHPQGVGDESCRDILDAFCKLTPQDDIDVAIMDEFNWGRKLQDLADELGVGVGTIHRRKQRLYKQYKELIHGPN
ncbi:MAG: sigma-70 RNA polymerase sigma factor region 4 domain-containing protein, partial [Planctomycetota bacterium]